ncbi:MAG: HisS family protein [Chloroflexota bacterium]|nr:HisS family protein [Chloroflexota bacterium]
MSDLVPGEMAKFRKVEAEFRDCCTSWGYQEIRTPVVEYLHLFTSAGTLSPDMLGRVYSFLDWDGWSGERVVLRPDGTIPVARLYVENYTDTPIVKLFYVENMFAFEGTGEESRECWQCGAELIGGNRPEGDVELISLAKEAIERLGVGPVKIRLAHAGFLKTFLEGLGLSGEEEADVVDRIFSGDMDVLSNVKGRGPELEKQVQLLFGLKGDSAGFVENLRGVFASFPELGPSLDELSRIASLLTSLGFTYEIDFTSGRGFEYYTGIIFGFYSGKRRLCGGGRYDKLIPLVGGGDVCASGFAFYIEELTKLIKEPPYREKILVKVRGTDNLKQYLESTRFLRDAGYIAEFDLGYRDTTGFRWTIDLLDENTVELTDQVTGIKQQVSTHAELLAAIGKATI